MQISFFFQFHCDNLIHAEWSLLKYCTTLFGISIILCWFHESYYFPHSQVVPQSLNDITSFINSTQILWQTPVHNKLFFEMRSWLTTSNGNWSCWVKLKCVWSDLCEIWDRGHFVPGGMVFHPQLMEYTLTFVGFDFDGIPIRTPLCSPKSD